MNLDKLCGICVCNTDKAGNACGPPAFLHLNHAFFLNENKTTVLLWSPNALSSIIYCPFLLLQIDLSMDIFYLKINGLIAFTFLSLISAHFIPKNKSPKYNPS